MKVDQSHQNPRCVFQELRREDNIAILAANKGRFTVIMDREDYTKKLRSLSEDDKYHVLNKDTTLKVEKRVASSLKSIHREGHITKQLYNQLTPDYSEPPHMNGPPKVHKEQVPMRPIVSTIGSPTYCLAK